MKRGSTPLRTAAVGAVLAAATLFTAVRPAEAIPAFARKYGASCQTCHIAYPKLNSYGEAFRLLGYRLPGETEEQVKQPDTSLGAEAYKRVWPDAVWPGAIPSQVPLAVTADFLVESNSDSDSDYDFVFPAGVGLVTAGTAGENVSYFGEIAFEQEVEDGTMESNVAVEHIDFRFIRPIRSSLAFNVKIGSFQPELVSSFDHARRLTVANYDSMFGVRTLELGGADEVGGGHGGEAGGIALPAIGRGFEGYGVVAHRFLWSAGVVNGLEPGQDTFDANDRKDVYTRLAYKWGGLAPDGSNADSFAASSKSWRETSFRLGAFAYAGDASGVFVPVDAHGEEGAPGSDSEDGHGALAAQAASLPRGSEAEEPEAAFLEGTDSTRYGLDFNLFYKDLNLFGAYVGGADDLRVFAADHEGAVGSFLPHESGEFTYDAWFVEADAVLRFPWLHGALRYEVVDLPARGADDFERATASVTGLIRANVKSTVEYTWSLNDSGDDFLWLSFGLAI